jgi:alanine racemase
MFTTEEISAFIGAHCVGDANRTVSRILTDSRSLGFPEDTLFFALTSQRNDGHKYIPQLYRRGVRAFVVRELPEGGAEGYVDASFLVVKDVLKALQRLAERHRDGYDIPIVGITGSNGKTMVKEWLSQLLSTEVRVTRSPRSYNSQIGVPLSVWLLDENTQVGVFEAGISQPGEMAALNAVIRPTLGIFTSLGEAHQENFTSLEQKCEEKMKLFRDAEALVYCMDDAVVAAQVAQLPESLQRIAWSKRDAGATVFVSNIDKLPQATTVTYLYRGATAQYVLPFTDEASVDDSIHCLVAALYLGIAPEHIHAAMGQLEPVAMRMEVLEGKRGCILINDTYNSDINSLDMALDFMSRRPERNDRRRTLVLSDLFQTGLSDEVLYERVAGILNERGVDRVIGIGSRIAQLEGRLKAAFVHFDSTEAFLQSALPEELSNEMILLKGARAFRFDAIADVLQLKVHETVMEIDLGAIVENLNYYRSFMAPETKMVCMVKAGAYGAGYVEVAKTLQDHCVDYLAVAVVDEGVELRKAGITTNIIVMNPEMNSFRTMFEYDLEPEVYSFRLLNALIAEAKRGGFVAYPIHVKLDTGMHRLGFHPVEDMDGLIETLRGQSSLMPRSVFSHFVGSDSDDFDAFSAHQFELFDAGSSRLQAAFRHKILRHICNSAGIEHFPQYHLDMVRLGLGLYGVNPRNNGVINSVHTLKTTILQIRNVPAEDTVGYSRRGVLGRASRIAALPIGYADGLNRHLGRGAGYCLVNGRKAPYVGNICMDVCMIDVTDIPCKEGDTAIIFGKELPVTVLSDILDTIPYEVLTGVGRRVKRVYYHEY